MAKPAIRSEIAGDNFSEGAAALRRCLDRNGWSQAELARKLDVLPAMVSRLLAGQRRPGRKLGQLIQRLAGVHPDLWDAPPRMRPSASRTG